MTQQLILIAGPWRSGTDGDQAKMDENLARLENAALAVYQRGHVPVIGNGLRYRWQRPLVQRPLGMKSVKRCSIPLHTGSLGNATRFIVLPVRLRELIWISRLPVSSG